MKVSQLFLPLIKETPSEAEIISHQLMLRAGMIRQNAAGIYSWLPMGLRVLRKIEQIVREEMDRAGAQEVLMPTIQPADLWRESGRYDAYGPEMLRIVDRHERDMLFGPTNEEMITDIFRRSVRSYRDLPLNLYHIQWKFRDEIRPRFGIMRGREFLMKDAYSFDIDHDAAVESYNAMFLAYLRTFRRMGLTAIPVQAETGPIGGDMSHEFQILADTGESQVYYDSAFDDVDFTSDDLDIEELKRLYAAADEKHDTASCPVQADQLRSGRGVEVGHIFHFGDKYSAAMDASVTTSTGENVFVQMGSYGIGVSRLVGAIIEAFHDEKGIVWPESVAPWKVVVINLRPADEACSNMAVSLYETLQQAGVEVLYDDRTDSAGVKFGSADLIGLPYQVVVGPRGVKNGVVEFRHRGSGAQEDMSPDDAVARLVA